MKAAVVVTVVEKTNQGASFSALLSRYCNITLPILSLIYIVIPPHSYHYLQFI
jgi:hypothetical protein